MATRKYTKRSDYWKKFEKNFQYPNNPYESLAGQKDQYEPKLIGDSFYNYTSEAYDRNGGSGSTERRRNSIAVNPKLYGYNNIRAGLLPYQYAMDGVNVREAIELCQKAYCNVAIFRNSIDMMADFANSPIHVEGGSEKSRRFINSWLRKIGIWNLKDQFFREYYRSGNIFLYTVEGKFKADDFAKVRNLGLIAATNKIPIRYIMLNPFDVVAQRTTSFDVRFFSKLLSEYEIERLKDPKNEADRELFDALPDNVKERIRNNSWTPSGMTVQLDPNKLRYAFYKKQDYEPFGVPYGFAVLDDINFKLEMKKIDQAICRTVENVVLMITMGTTPDKGGVNPRNMHAMQNLFTNQSVGRVLVSDYTTKADFIIPDLQKVLGPAKYDVINQDIKEGLQNAMLGEEKFANATIKAQLFLQRLHESREAFLKEFLQPEIDQLSRNFGFRTAPQAKFEDIDMKDENQVQRVITRMMELGILSPEEGMKVIDTGVFPSREELEESQEKFLEDRKKGWYNPLVGGVPVFEGEDELEIKELEHPRSMEMLEKQNNKTPKSPGRPLGSKTQGKTTYAVDAIKDTIDATNAFYSTLNLEARKIFKKKRLSADQKSILQKVCEAVICSSEQAHWSKTATSCLKDNKQLLQLSILPSVRELSAEHSLDEYSSAILYHSSQRSPKD
tara:strand:+ start:5596 stop:7611 length:2016 start_codon:yes stop_codon:yes gene_type:complete